MSEKRKRSGLNGGGGSEIKERKCCCSRWITFKKIREEMRSRDCD